MIGLKYKHVYLTVNNVLNVKNAKYKKTYKICRVLDRIYYFLERKVLELLKNLFYNFKHEKLLFLRNFFSCVDDTLNVLELIYYLK